MNRLTLVGRLTRDPELRALPSGQSVCKMRLAVDGRREDDTVFIDVATFGAQAEACARYLTQGRQVSFDAAGSPSTSGPPRTARCGPSTRRSATWASWTAGRAAPATTTPMSRTLSGPRIKTSRSETDYGLGRVPRCPASIRMAIRACSRSIPAHPGDQAPLVPLAFARRPRHGLRAQDARVARTSRRPARVRVRGP
jgi:single-stranded DNA-binding protein